MILHLVISPRRKRRRPLRRVIEDKCFQLQGTLVRSIMAVSSKWTLFTSIFWNGQPLTWLSDRLEGSEVSACCSCFQFLLHDGMLFAKNVLFPLLNISDTATIVEARRRDLAFTYVCFSIFVSEHFRIALCRTKFLRNFKA